MTVPTDRQLEVARAVARHDGNNTAAAAELGVTPETVTIVMNAYRKRLVAQQAIRDEVRRELVAEKSAEFGIALDRLERLAERLERALATPRPVAEPSHRRKADGGRGGRRERRQGQVA